MRSRVFVRAAAAIGLLAVGSGLAASCRGVVAGKAEDGVGALCDLLKQCYGDAAPSCEDMNQRFAEAEDADNDDFLGFLTANDCLTTCSAAKKCWDHAPVCGVPEETCTHPEQCCGFTRGLASCDGEHCCVPHAVVCDRENGAPCCNGEQCFTPLPGQQPPTCGGVPPCANALEPCTDNFECCSKQCGADGFCQEQKTCVDEGAKCIDDTDCCDDQGLHCEIDPNDGGHCRQVECTIGSACSNEGTTGVITCSPGAPDSCCGHANLCVPDESGIFGVCIDFANDRRLPIGFDCSSNEDCCTGYCDLSSTPICTEPPTTMCQTFLASCFDPAMTCAQCTPETQKDDCCSGECVNARCTCGNSECHSPYGLGGPLACTLPNLWQECADDVCKDDPFCCCTEWDGICIQEAAVAFSKGATACSM